MIKVEQLQLVVLKGQAKLCKQIKDNSIGCPECIQVVLDGGGLCDDGTIIDTE
jgi:hypothetical protein